MTIVDGESRSGASRRMMRGMVRIEAMAMLVLCLSGALAIVGLQTRAAQARSDGVLQAQAAELAAELIAEIRTTSPNARSLAFDSDRHGPRYARWLRKLQSGPVALPGAIEHPPTVSVVSNTARDGDRHLMIAEVTVTIYWQRRGRDVHQHVTTVRIPDPVT
ncbi:MAG: hypothetical protein QM674_02180 [Burkholderiaceae bacterium]